MEAIDEAVIADMVDEAMAQASDATGHVTQDAMAEASDAPARNPVAEAPLDVVPGAALDGSSAEAGQPLDQNEYIHVDVASGRKLVCTRF